MVTTWSCQGDDSRKLAASVVRGGTRIPLEKGGPRVPCHLSWFRGAAVSRWSKGSTIAFGFALAAACNGKHEGLTVSDRVYLYCSDLASGLDFAAKTYEEAAPALDAGQLSPEQRQRFASGFLSDGIGLSFETRLAKMQGIYKQFMFCVSVRQIDDARRNTIYERVGKLHQALSEQDLEVPGIQLTISHVEAAKDLRELATLAREVSDLPRQE